MVRRQNEGSFGCEAVARALGQPNVPECAVGFHFLCLYAAKISLSFCRLFLSFYNERQHLCRCISVAPILSLVVFLFSIN